MIKKKVNSQIKLLNNYKTNKTQITTIKFNPFFF